MAGGGTWGGLVVLRSLLTITSNVQVGRVMALAKPTDGNSRILSSQRFSPEHVAARRKAALSRFISQSFTDHVRRTYVHTTSS